MEVDNEGYRCNKMCNVERAIVQTLIGRIAGDLQDCQDWPENNPEPALLAKCLDVIEPVRTMCIL